MFYTWEYFLFQRPLMVRNIPAEAPAKGTTRRGQEVRANFLSSPPGRTRVSHDQRAWTTAADMPEEMCEICPNIYV